MIDSSILLVPAWKHPWSHLDSGPIANRWRLQKLVVAVQPTEEKKRPLVLNGTCLLVDIEMVQKKGGGVLRQLQMPHAGTPSPSSR